MRPATGTLTATALAGLLLLPTGTFAACKLGKYADLPVTMVGMRPTITAQINGQDATFLFRQRRVL